MANVPTFQLKVLNVNELIYTSEVKSLIIKADQSEFELLPFHMTLVALLPEGFIIIDAIKELYVSKGLICFHNNMCVVLAERSGKELFVDTSDADDD